MQKTAAGTYEKEIDGALYEFCKWPAEESLETLVDLTAITGGSLGPALANLRAGGQVGNLPVERLLNALSTQLGVNREAVLRVLRRLGELNVMCEGKPVRFTTHYQNRMLHLFKVVRAALEVQYGDFFDVLGDLFDKLDPATTALGTSTGASGDPSKLATAA